MIGDCEGRSELPDYQLPNHPMRAVVLLSGGLDSYTAAAIARAEGFALYALTIHYGQRHAREIEAARAVARALGVERHLELRVDLRAIGGSSLTSDAAGAARSRSGRRPDIPSTYVPARNTIFLSLALGWAEVARRPRHRHRRQCARLFRLSRLPAGVHRARSSGWRIWRRAPASRARGFACTRRSSR